jgi:hypothetical protein
MSNINSLRGEIGAALVFLMVAAPVVAVAQQSGTKTLTTVAQIDVQRGPHGANSAISPDGTTAAFFDDKYPPVLYIKNLQTNEQNAILKSPAPPAAWAAVQNLAFSPDGASLIFLAGPPLRDAASIYTVHVDGTKLTELASDQNLPLNPSDPSQTTYQEMDLAKPLYSPDGNKVLIEVTRETGTLDSENHFQPTIHRTFVALLSSQGVGQKPDLLAEGNPRFWSADGTAVYYTRLNDAQTDVILYHFDLATQQSETMAMPWTAAIIGRVPGHDAVFLRTHNTQNFPSISVVNLDGTPASSEFAKIAASIPIKDSEGRYLQSIEKAGQYQLLLRYSGTSAKAGIARQHDELVTFK